MSARNRPAMIRMSRRFFNGSLSQTRRQGDKETGSGAHHLVALSLVTRYSPLSPRHPVRLPAQRLHLLAVGGKCLGVERHMPIPDAVECFDDRGQPAAQGRVVAHAIEVLAVG